jgi:hypothetical protein
MLPQLDLLSVTADLYIEFEDIWNLDVSSCSLVDLSTTNLRDHPSLFQDAQHLRLDTFCGDEDGSKALVSKNLLALIEVTSPAVHRDSHPLRSIYVDASLRPLPNDSDSTRNAVDNLLQQCNHEGIDLIYEDQSGRDSWPISEEFCRRHRKGIPMFEPR